ncbi:hypothetical protein [Pleionea sediminis]|uniref:hypothetical protein n=1 Tax=Pleionea sediminis TaxID=2569479 RepID=UPI001185AC54|nr:hypothetical protein [Pleionea sediminis]
MKKLNQIKLFKIFGIQVYIHWTLILSLLVVGVLGFDKPLLGFFIMGTLTILFIHELGHAFLAHRYNLDVQYISLNIFNGVCVHEEADTEFVNAMIAWGGVFAQVLIAVPVIATHLLLGSNIRDDVEMILLTFGYFNLLLIVLNLLPLKGFDGSLCWKVIPLHFKYGRKKAKAKKKNHLKSVK